MEIPLIKHEFQPIDVGPDQEGGVRPRTRLFKGRSLSALRPVRDMYRQTVVPVNQRALKSRIYFILMTGSATSRMEQFALTGLISFVFLSVLSAMIETLRFGDSGLEAFKEHACQYIEPISTVVFTILYGMRLWSCVTDLRLPKGCDGAVHPILGRLRWAIRPMSLVELLTIVPWYIYVVSGESFNLYCCKPLASGHGQVHIPTVVSILRIMRIMRIVRLYRFSPSLKLLARVIVLKRGDLRMAFILDGVLVIVMASIIYFCEHNDNDKIRSMYTSLYFTTITLTTVGYGDISPVTDAGRLVASICSAVGIGLFTLPTTILAQGFLDLKTETAEERINALNALAEVHHRRCLRLAFLDWAELADEAEEAERRRAGEEGGGSWTKAGKQPSCNATADTKWVLLSSLVSWAAAQPDGLAPRQVATLRSLVRAKSAQLDVVADTAVQSVRDLSAHLADAADAARA